ncbi:MFS transporter [Nocardioides sp. SYSU D00038]|uniref:MFS transporter n=1 Tax=Nocardioides sp. SYSU D00038 TaxID=2812554 RepID=UPI0027DC24A0|nr:MFS transporter [Nocardioides sp. SYSU D00038]
MTFALNGLLFSSLAVRIPDLRHGLDLDNRRLGLLLLAIAAGSLLALPTTGRLIERWSTPVVARAGILFAAAGLVVAAVGAGPLGLVAVAAPGLFGYGIGIGVWDVAMNVEGAEVERRLGHTIMPRFHAAFSVGTIAGAGIGVPVAAVDLPMTVHLAGVVVLALVVGLPGARAFLPPAPEPQTPAAPARSAWREPRVLAVGVMVLAFAVVEGSANDWLTLAVIDGYDAPHWAGVLAFAGFVTAMTLGRVVGPAVLDRHGRAAVLWACAALATAGILLLVWGGHPALAGLGVLLWGLGGSLGFPVGMSAAADDPARAAARVSVVATIGYAAFLAGPPLLGALGDRVGTLESLLAVAALMVPAAVTVLAARPPRVEAANRQA